MRLHLMKWNGSRFEQLLWTSVQESAKKGHRERNCGICSPLPNKRKRLNKEYSCPGHAEIRAKIGHSEVENFAESLECEIISQK